MVRVRRFDRAVQSMIMRFSGERAFAAIIQTSMSGKHGVGISDTSPDAAEVQLRIYRAMSPARKIALVEDANRTARRLALAGIELRYPHASESERFRLLMDLILGKDLAEKAYGPFTPPTGR